MAVFDALLQVLDGYEHASDWHCHVMCSTSTYCSAVLDMMGGASYGSFLGYSRPGGLDTNSGYLQSLGEFPPG